MRFLRFTHRSYPRGFWLLLWGAWLNATGGGMVWPFLSLYLRQRLPVPLTLITLLLSWNAAVGRVTTAVAGVVVDRFGSGGI